MGWTELSPCGYEERNPKSQCGCLHRKFKVTKIPQSNLLQGDKKKKTDIGIKQIYHDLWWCMHFCEKCAKSASLCLF